MPGSIQLTLNEEVLHEDRILSKRSIQNDNVTEEQKSQQFNQKDEDFIDLTKLNQNNVDCFEQCNRVKCPLHQKLFSVANSKECEHCARLLQKLRSSSTRAQDRSQNEIPEVERRRLSYIDGGSKVVDFALSGDNIYSSNKYEKNESNEQKRSVRNYDLPNRSVESTKTLNFLEADEVRKRTKGTINLYKDSQFEIKDDNNAKNQEPRSYSNIEKIPETESIISTKSLSISETKELRKRTMGSVNIHKDIYNAEQQNQKRDQTDTESTMQSSLSQVIDVSNKPNVPCQGLLDINNPVYRNTKNLCFTQECSQPSDSFPYSRNQVDNSQFFTKTSTNNSNTDATKVKSKIGSFLSASEPNGLSAAEKPVNVMDSKYLKANGDQNGSRFQAEISNAKVINKGKQYGNNSRSGIEFTKHNETCLKFDQNSDSSAIFRKVFLVDGVGLECQCSISSFKRSTDK